MGRIRIARDKLAGVPATDDVAQRLAAFKLQDAAAKATLSSDMRARAGAYADQMPSLETVDSAYRALGVGATRLVNAKELLGLIDFGARDEYIRTTPYEVLFAVQLDRDGEIAADQPVVGTKEFDRARNAHKEGGKFYIKIGSKRPAIVGGPAFRKMAKQDVGLLMAGLILLNLGGYAAALEEGTMVPSEALKRMKEYYEDYVLSLSRRAMGKVSAAIAYATNVGEGGPVDFNKLLSVEKGTIQYNKERAKGHKTQFGKTLYYLKDDNDRCGPLVGLNRSGSTLNAARFRTGRQGRTARSSSHGASKGAFYRACTLNSSMLQDVGARNPSAFLQERLGVIGEEGMDEVRRAMGDEAVRFTMQARKDLRDHRERIPEELRGRGRAGVVIASQKARNDGFLQAFRQRVAGDAGAGAGAGVGGEMM